MMVNTTPKKIAHRQRQDMLTGMWYFLRRISCDSFVFHVLMRLFIKNRFRHIREVLKMNEAHGMNYPEKAWLLLTKDKLYLMSSDVDGKYHESISIEETDDGEPLIKGIPPEWFKRERHLVVNLHKKPTPLNN